MPAGYVTQYGSLDNDGLSWETPLRSIQSAFDKGYYPVYIKGYFNEKISNTGLYAGIIGEDVSVLDGTLIPGHIKQHSHAMAIQGLIIQNCEKFVAGDSNGHFKNNVFKNVGKVGRISYVISNLFNKADVSVRVNDNRYYFSKQNTFYNIDLILNYDENVTSPDYNVRDYNVNNNIYSHCNISVISKLVGIERFSLFHNSNFKFTGGGLGADETEYTAPIGADDEEKLNNIRQRMVTVYGGELSDYLNDCKYQTNGNLFIDPSTENFHLVKGCQASKMSYQGQWVGKYPESDFQVVSGFESTTNIDGNGKIIDVFLDAVAETTIIDFGKLRHIDGFKALGNRGLRNGNVIMTESNLGPQINPGTDLVDGKTYIVRAEAINLTLSNKTRDVGETFIAKVADGLAFTNTVDGYVQEVYIEKTEAFIEVKTSKIDPTLGTAQWLRYKLVGEPEVNYDENGVAQYGNADIDFDDANKDKLFARYAKARITIKAKNLPA